MDTKTKIGVTAYLLGLVIISIIGSPLLVVVYALPVLYVLVCMIFYLIQNK